MTSRANRSPSALARRSAVAVAAVAAMSLPAAAGADPAPSAGKPTGSTQDSGPARSGGSAQPSSSASATSSTTTVSPGSARPSSSTQATAADYNTRTPIKHLVVILQENRSFDHYFATYPKAANIPGETLQGSGLPAPKFTASTRTPRKIDTLKNAGLLGSNNHNTWHPFRLSPAQAVTCSQNHTYVAQQKAFNGGQMDMFVEYVSRDVCRHGFGTTGLTMGYYDGNTVTAMWNYAQHFAMSDNFFSSTFGPSTPGALNLISGQTFGARSYDQKTRVQTPKPDNNVMTFPNAQGAGTMIGDPDPVWDDCSDPTYPQAGMDGKNIGDRLNEKGVTWGWFQGGFTPYIPATDTTRARCGYTRPNVGGVQARNYIPHHQPFQYYKSTANPSHLPPSSTAMIGRTDQANHQYDLSEFDKVVNTPDMPAVTFLKAYGNQNGHASYSSPLDEQTFLVETINKIQMSPNWPSTAVVITYDDSDGWYDHKAPVITNASNTKDDSAICTRAAAAGVPIRGGHVNRCGPGPRLPFLVISPYAKANYVNHYAITQASVLRFIEYNWRTRYIGKGSTDITSRLIAGHFNFRTPTTGRVLLDPRDGTVVSADYPRCNRAQTCQPRPSTLRPLDWLRQKDPRRALAK